MISVWPHLIYFSACLHSFDNMGVDDVFPNKFFFTAELSLPTHNYPIIKKSTNLYENVRLEVKKLIFFQIEYTLRHCIATCVEIVSGDPPDSLTSH